ncbi:hypothetical protein F5B18DRAFT_656105 [Nemania serpens]|nr:hypothetical protein F5B18DRAFT_656105 [Nemania serpens]
MFTQNNYLALLVLLLQELLLYRLFSLSTIRSFSSNTGIDNMGLLDTFSALVQYLWPSQEELLQTKTQAAIRATGLYLATVSERENLRKMLLERDMPEDHRTQGKKILAEMGQCPPPSQEETDLFVSHLEGFDVPKEAKNIWALLDGQPFCVAAIFPSAHQLDYVATLISPIASETGLRHFARDTIENAVQKQIDAAYNDEQLRADLGIQGSATFENHTNLGGSVDSITKSIEHINIAQGGTGATTPPSPPAETASNQCQSRNVPALAIEYKAPHKLTRDEVVTGLREIQPERDVINKDNKSFASRWLVAAVNHTAIHG